LTGELCLYLCSAHLEIALLKVQFGQAIDQILNCEDSICNYCKRNARVRLFLNKEHWLVNELLKELEPCIIK